MYDMFNNWFICSAISRSMILKLIISLKYGWISIPSFYKSFFNSNNIFCRQQMIKDQLLEIKYKINFVYLNHSNYYEYSIIGNSNIQLLNIDKSILEEKWSIR